MLKLQADVAELRETFRDFERRMEATMSATQAAMREGFGNVGRALDKFGAHLAEHADVLGEITAKVNEHEDRIAAIESKLP